jgi:hypothetical protein
MTPAQQASRQWSIETETEVVSTIWRQPYRIAEFMRDFDFQIHLTQPHLRIILEGINLAYGDLGDTSFAVVAQTVRELGGFEECGGLQGLNSVYAATEITPVTDPIFAHLCDMLRLYAEGRQTDPPQPVYRFTGGRGTAHRVKGPIKRIGADFSGVCYVRGTKYRVDVEVGSESQFLNFRLVPEN